MQVIPDPSTSGLRLASQLASTNFSRLSADSRLVSDIFKTICGVEELKTNRQFKIFYPTVCERKASQVRGAGRGCVLGGRVQAGRVEDWGGRLHQVGHLSISASDQDNAKVDFTCSLSFSRDVVIFSA